MFVSTIINTRYTFKKLLIKFQHFKICFCFAEFNVCLDVCCYHLYREIDMGWKKKSFVFLLPIALYYAFKLIKAHFVIFVLITNQILPRLPFESYKQLNPDINDFATPASELLDEYDFVVVGAGSAGAVVANRLSENASWKILLLEAGGGESIFSEVPGFSPLAIDSELNWGYTTEPNEDNFTSTNQLDARVSWPRGKSLGGTTVINGVIYARGNKKDYDSWEQQGNPGWNYENVLSYFKKSEDNRDEEISQSEYYHSKGGPLTVESPKGYPDVILKTMEACKKLLPHNLDYNGEKQMGCFLAQLNRRDGRRCSTAKAFLTPKRKNLHISPLSHVHKIIIDPDSKKASGIIYRKSGQLKKVKSKKEIVLSAGAIGSPQVWIVSSL